VLGRNGEGKSSLFKTVLGLLPPLAGTVRVDGQAISGWNARRRALSFGYVPQSVVGGFPFTVREIVLMGRTAHRGPFSAPSSADRDAADEAIATLGIGHLAEREWLRVSGGERQLALVARALAQEPRILVLDEPTSISATSCGFSMRCAASPANAHCPCCCPPITPSKLSVAPIGSRSWPAANCCSSAVRPRPSPPRRCAPATRSRSQCCRLPMAATASACRAPTSPDDGRQAYSAARRCGSGSSASSSARIFGGDIGRSRNRAPIAAWIALATAAIGGTIMVMNREEVFRATGPTSGGVIEVKLGAKRDGTIVAAELVLKYQAGAFPGSPVQPGCMCAFAMYDLPNVNIVGYDVVSNRPKVAAYRAPGAPISSFGVESCLDELARELLIDPLALREKNAAKEGTKAVHGPTWTNIGYLDSLTAVRKHPNYQIPLGPNQGRGIACGFWFNVGGESSAMSTRMARSASPRAARTSAARAPRWR
jgi:hypothetical protein